MSTAAATGVPRTPHGWARLTWQRIPIAEIRILNPRREAAIFTGYALFFILLSYCTGLLIRHYPLPVPGAGYFLKDFWYIVLFKLIGLLTVPLVIFRALGYGPRDLLLDWRPTRRRVLSLTLSFLAGFIINSKHFSLIYASEFTGGEAAARIVIGFMLPLLTAGLPEEIVYRGILQTRLEAAVGRLVAIFATAILFTAWHLPTRYLLAQGVEGRAGDFTSVFIGTGIPVFVAGLLFGILWDRYRSLPPLIAAHWGVDALPSISAMLGKNF